MILTKYKEKRNFNKSPEPEGGSPDIDKLRFVIQKHAASRLHYDLRLEMDGVLKSWAVPKGPSTDPSIKRLAIMVEDHPYDYRNFEGIIPGGYGAGTVMVWDEGIYAMADANGRDKKNQDTEMQKGIHAGKLHFELHGHKLKGEYALVKTNGKGENSWLLFKVKDKHVSKEDITLKDKSVLSKKTLEQLERTSASSSKKAAVNGKKGSPTNKSSDINAAPSKNKKETESPISMDQVLSKGKKGKVSYLNITDACCHC